MPFFDRKWWNPFDVAPLMRRARRQGLSAEAAAAAVKHPSQEEMDEVAAAVTAWIRRRIAEGHPPARLRLLWFLLFKCNRGRAVQLTLLAIAFMIFRILNNGTFTLFMAVLAYAPEDLVLLSFLPSVPGAIIFYASAALGASTLNYLVDQAAKNLGTRIRMQLVWIVQDATLRATQAAAAPFPSSEVVSLAGIDAMAVEWAIWMLPYALVVPVEIVFLLYLSCGEVGAVPTGYALIPLVIGVALKMFLVKVASRKQAAARGVQMQRLNVLNEAIVSNSVLKLMGIGEKTLDDWYGDAAAHRRAPVILVGRQ